MPVRLVGSGELITRLGVIGDHLDAASTATVEMVAHHVIADARSSMGYRRYPERGNSKTSYAVNLGGPPAPRSGGTMGVLTGSYQKAMVNSTPVTTDHIARTRLYVTFQGDLSNIFKLRKNEKKYPTFGPALAKAPALLESTGAELWRAAIL